MANTYTPKLNLAKPAHGDVNWHIPVNENWDKIDTELDKALKISGTTIDADKNWNGKSITNVNQIQAASANITEITTSRYSLLPDSTLCYADNTEVSREGGTPTIVKTAPPVPAGRYGTVTVYFNLKTTQSASRYAAHLQIHKNGVSVYSTRTDSYYYVDYATNINVAPGDVLALALFAEPYVTATNTRFEIHAITLPGIINSLRW